MRHLEFGNVLLSVGIVAAMAVTVLACALVI